MAWQPSEQGLQEVLGMLRDTSSVDSEVQRNVAQRLEQLRFVPDFLAYLAHVLIHCTGEQDSHRAVAGLLLKNSLNQRSGPTTNENDARAMAYVKNTVLTGLADPDQIVRQTVGTVIMCLISNEDVGAWPEALDALTKGMGSTDPNVVEGSFNTLQKICEDAPHKLDFQVQGRDLLDHLVPQFIEFTNHNVNKVRLYSLQILQSLLSIGIAAVTANIDNYIRALFNKASDPSPDIRKSVCASLGLILGSRPDKLVPEMGNVVDYIVFCTQDDDETVALEASEFWLTFAEDASLKDQLRPYLPKIAPLLLNKMVYSDYDIAVLDMDEYDEDVADKETDIKPRNYSSKVHAAHETNDPSSSKGAGFSREAADRAFEEDEEEDDEEDDEFFDDEDGTGEWNIRKCSAATLDVLAVSFGAELLEILLPHLRDKIFDAEWQQRESGVLALGAIAEGCIAGLEPHLPQLVPFLLRSLEDKKALVRSITCWSLGRYASWIVQVNPEDKTQYFIPTMEGLLRMVLDHNKRVQEAGCSAFATLEEEAGTEMAPFLEPVLRNLTYAFSKYQQKNLLILYDAIGTLADSVGDALGQPGYLEILMPPLIDRWQRLGDNDPDLVPLLECLSSVSIAASQSFTTYTPPVYQRCLNIIHTTLQQYSAFEQDPDNVDEPDRTFIVVALDLLSGLVQGMGEAIHPLILEGQPPLLHLLALCLTHYEPPVRQSAHALLGDMAISCFPILKPVVPQILPSVIEQIVVEPPADCISVCNNAAWAVGEVALQFNNDSAALEPFVPALIQRLIPILLSSKSPKSLSENAAVTIGRLGLVCPALVAPELPNFAQAWCTALWEIKDNDEKDSAFRGLCMMISANPEGIQSSFVWFCNAICKWQHPSAQLDEMFRTILQGFKNGLGAQWDAQMSNFPPVIRQRLAERYGV
ncbi:importin beta-2 subunit [Cryptococcus neoformans Bt63]|nr:importin beta-2 subunit [Cryptococcus neoformans var. grubii Bt63]